MIAITSYVVDLTTCVINAIMSPVAVVGNALILAAIWRNPSLRTPSYVLLGGLAITDFLSGLISLPFMVATTVVEFTNTMTPFFCFLTGVFLYGIASYLALNAIFTITLMSVERWLHISRNSMVTVGRVYKAYIAICLLPIPFVVLRLSQSLDGCIYLREDAVEGILVLLCLLITTVFYSKVFQIIHRHQNQIQANQPNQNFGQPSIDLVKYKKSVITILYILAIFAVCYLPSALFLIVMIFYQNFQFSEEVIIVTKVLPTLYFLSSSLNPILYCWRIRDLRIGVKQLLMNIFHQDV